MALASFILGIIASVGVLIGLIPLLGWVNWLALPVAVAGLIVGIIAANSGAQQNRSGCLATLGIVINCLNLGFGILRLFMGGGII